MLLGALVFSGATAVGSTAAPKVEAGTFRALSYNVAGLPEGLSSSQPAINMPFISPLLNPYDLVLTQEDWANPDPPIEWARVFHEVLISQVTHPYKSIPMPVPLGTDPVRPSALISDGLNRLSRMPFGMETRVMWPDCFGGTDTSDGGAGDCLSQKGFSVATTELAPGVEVDVYNLHGEAGSTPLDVQYRAEGYAVLADYINAHSAGHAVIVGGDFNLHSNRPVDQAVMQTLLDATGLTDTRSVVDSDPDRDQIDKFLFRSGNGITLEPLTHVFEAEKFTRPTDGAPLSDHDPLSVDFGWSVDATPPSTTVTTPEVDAPQTVPASSTVAAGTTPPNVEAVAVRGSEPVPGVSTLAETGAPLSMTVLFGGAMLAAGAGVTAGARRRSRRMN